MGKHWKRPETILENTPSYADDRLALRFLLGGIGTGNISLTAAGVMTDFELFNHPDKGLKYPFNFYSIWSQVEGEPSTARVLEAYPKGIDDTACGVPAGLVAGLPRYDSSVFSCQYPFANIAFEKAEDPIKVSLCAFTPFIPLDADNSGLPGFAMTYTVKNTASKPAQVSIASTMHNITGHRDYDYNRGLKRDGKLYNKIREENGLTGIMMGIDELPENDLSNGTMCIATESSAGVTVKPHWQSGWWFDGAEAFWQDFIENGELCVEESVEPGHGHGAGSVALKKTLAPGESREFKFFYFWHFPNRYGWWPDTHHWDTPVPDGRSDIQRNYYAKLWPDAWAAMDYFHTNYDMLFGKSRDFADALYSSTLGSEVIESLVVGLTVLRSHTIFRLESGEFYGWEGCSEHKGSCYGTCTHVWNYAQTAAFLFPEMEKSMRRTEFLEEVNEEGRMAFRARHRLDKNANFDFHPAADGQWGSIARVYREWKLSGDDAFLKKVWEKLALCVEYSLKWWDKDGDGVMESQQHNTYDIEFYGVNSLTNSIMYAGLRAAGKMAEHVGDERGKKWLEIAEKGSEKMDEMLWNGEYYKQEVVAEGLNHYKYQYGDGCLSDQLLGQTLAHLYGLGYVLPKAHVQSAARAIYENNFRPVIGSHWSVQRGFVYQDEGGLLLCSWPHGGRPLKPFVYSDEVWTGIEYQVATQLIYEGMIDEAMNIVSAIRARHNGCRRSPYNEMECGNHYARSMAAWGMLIALSGYTYDLTKGEIAFAPQINKDDFACLYSNGKEWGIMLEKNGKQEIIPLNA